MPTVTAVPRLRVTLVSSFRDQIAINVLHYCNTPRVSVAFDETDLANFASIVSPFLAAKLKPCMVQTAKYLGMRVRHLAALPADDQEVTTTLGNGFGTFDSVNAAPSQVCGLIKKKTATVGRRGRGRMYVPFPAQEAAAADDTVATAYDDALQDLAVALDTIQEVDPFGSTSLVFEPCLIFRDSPAGVLPITSHIPRGGFATQRRRGYFGRPNPAIL